MMGKSFDAGAVYFLQKPFETNELRETVRLVLKTGS
ncbi:MAG: DNA-binding response OmpR family regulator [Myxococcota bacterium]